MSFTNSFFEATSGITTTGATTITTLNDAPPGILLWRAILQWLGGIGIIVMAMAVMPFLKVGGMQLFRTESSENEKALPRAAQLSTALTLIYMAITVFCTIAYMAVGLNAFTALAHAMTTISTGGYSTYDESFRAFSGAGPQLVAITFMIIGGLPFILFLKMLRGNLLAMLKDSQVQTYLGILFGATIVLTLHLIWTMDMSAEEAWIDVMFTVTSLMTGTGYANSDYDAWGGFATSLLLFLMVVGGCAGSTTCGIKVFRFQVLYIVAKTQVRQLLHPSGVFTPRYNGRPLQEEVIISVMSFFFVFALCFMVVAIILSATGLDMLTALSAATASLANVGPGLGPVIGATGTFQPLSDTAKWVLSLSMIIGRLELFTVLVLFSPHFWRS